MRDKLHSALLKLELRERDVARREQRNAYLEGELKIRGQHHTNALNEVVRSSRNWQSGDWKLAKLRMYQACGAS
jgi:hypothetical protein